MLLYAHGGLVDERSAIQRLAEYRSAMMDVHVYPISFIWHSDYWSTVTHVLQDAMRQRRPEGVLDAAKNLLLERLEGSIERLALFALTDEAEQDDNCANIYRKSLLYLVSRSFEESPFGDGTPLLGMQRWLERDLDLVDLFKTNRRASLVYSPNTYGKGTAKGARARAHNDFDDDPYTTKATLRRILESAGAAGSRAKSPEFRFRPGGITLRTQREQIDRQAPMRV